MAEAPDPLLYAAEQRAEQARNLRYVITVDGDEFVFRLGDLTAADSKALRGEGLTVRDLLIGLDGTIAEFDKFAAVMWMARRQKGDRDASYTDILDGLRFDQVIMAQPETSPEAAEDYPDPERSGGS